MATLDGTPVDPLLYADDMALVSTTPEGLQLQLVASLRSMVLSDDRNPLLNRARTFIKRAEVTLLSAESTRLAELMPEPVRAARLPRPVWVFSCFSVAW